MRWRIRHPFKTALLFAWAGSFVVTWAVQTGGPGLAGRPVWSYERCEVTPGASSVRQPVARADIAQLAAKRDGTRAYFRSVAVAEHRGVVRVTASSQTYVLDQAPTAAFMAQADGFSMHAGLDRFQQDHPEQGTAPILYFRNDIERQRLRFPMSDEEGWIKDDRGEWVRVARDPDFGHTFVRTANWLSNGWDLDVRVPFRLIYLTLASPLLPLALVRIGRRLRRRRRRARGRCEQCGYDLRGRASDRCPECGHPAP